MAGTSTTGAPVELRNSAGTEVGTSGAPVRTDPTGSTIQPVSLASSPLPTGAATEATLATRLSESDFDTKTGSLTETAPATDTASSGMNGRLQRVAQRLSSLIALLPSALVGGRLDVNVGATGVTQPVSGTVTANAGTGTFAVQATAAAPASARLSDGAAFYDATKTGQLPTALVGGRLDVVVGAALPAGANNIGDVDVITLPNVTLAAGTNTNEVVGDVAHDAVAAGNPVLVGGFASAAAPAAVSGDADAVRAWYLRNGAAATVVTAAGALIGGDAANGLDVDVTRLPALVEGTANIGDVDVVTLPAIPTGTNSIGRVAAGGVSVQVSTAFTRPADTTAYAAGDAVTNSTSAPVVMTFANCARVSGGTGIITGCSMVDSANVATAGSFELWIFTASPTPDNDNAVFTPTDAELATLVGVYALTTSYVGDATVGAGGNRFYEGDEKLKPFTCATTSLFGLLVVRNAYVPVSGETFTPILRILQD